MVPIWAAKIRDLFASAYLSSQNQRVFRPGIAHGAENRHFPETDRSELI